MPSTPQGTDAASAFDALAETYDIDFSSAPTAGYLRGTVQRRLKALVQAGDQVLELGCGTGIDAKYLSECGAIVLATDASSKMLHMASKRLAESPNVSLAPLDLRHLPTGDPRFETQFDLVFANFGVVNCVTDLQTLANWLSERVKPGGYAAFAIMSRYCVWETAWHSIHGDFKTASRRWRHDSIVYSSESGITTVHYPSVWQIQRIFSPDFKMRRVTPLGFFLPPSDIFRMVEKRPRFHNFLTGLENTFRFMRILADFSDHFWIEFQRIES